MAWFAPGPSRVFSHGSREAHHRRDVATARTGAIFRPKQVDNLAVEVVSYAFYVNATGGVAQLVRAWDS